MSAPKAAQQLYIDGPSGRLEAVLDLPREGDPAGVSVVCHPHPQHGGTMHNKVAHTLSRAFTDCGLAALRFNFRGTGSSEGSYDEGVGEVDDAAAVIAWARHEFGAESVWLGGFSFGAAIAIRAALDESLLGLVTVAPAVRRFASGLRSQPDCAWLVVTGDRDDLVDVGETVAWVDSLDPGPELLVMEGAEHFFHGRLVELRKHVAEFVMRSERSRTGA